MDISIIDINEFPPEFEKTIYNISITENSQTPMIILPLRATDKDMVSVFKKGQYPPQTYNCFLIS